MAATPTAPLLSARAQFLFPAVVGVLTVAVLSTVFDLVVAGMANPRDGLQFRFQLIGNIFASSPQVAVRLALIAAVGTLGGYRIAARAASIVAVALGVVMILLLPFYTLDFVQARRLVEQNALKGFTLAGEKTGLFAGVVALVLIWVGIRAFQASQRAEEGERKMKGQGLIVGQE